MLLKHLVSFSHQRPVGWHICAADAVCVMPLVVTNITHNFTAQIITQKFVLHMNTQLWLRWQTYSSYFQIVCHNTNAVSKFKVMNFLYIPLLTPRFLKWPRGFRNICGPQPQCVHVIHPFRRKCETTCSALWCADYLLCSKYLKPLTFLNCWRNVPEYISNNTVQ